MRHLLITMRIFDYYASLISLYFLSVDQWLRGRHACCRKQRLNRRQFPIEAVWLLRNRTSNDGWTGSCKDIGPIALRQPYIRKTAETRVAVASSEASHGSVFHDIFVLRDARIIEINARFFETAISGE